MQSANSPSAPSKFHFQVRLADWNLLGDRAKLRTVRQSVFVEEQHVPANLEWDDAVDCDCVQALAEDESGRPIGTGRIKPDGQIGRIAVLAGWRRRGVGRSLLRTLIAVGRRHQLDRIWLNAQLPSLDFYLRQGFQPIGATFYEAGIAHRRMTLTPVRTPGKRTAHG